MGAEKLSISLDSELAAQVRAAANEQGVTVSTWLSDAARAQVRQRFLREALDALAAEIGELSDEEVERLVAESRRRSRLISGNQGAA